VSPGHLSAQPSPHPAPHPSPHPGPPGTAPAPGSRRTGIAGAGDSPKSWLLAEGSRDLLGAAEILDEDERLRLIHLDRVLQEKIAPAAAEYWNREELPPDWLELAGELGLGRLQLDGTSRLFKGLVYATVSRADVSLCALVGIHNELVIGMIDRLGSDAQREEWLPQLTTLNATGSFALTEPEHGSDVAGGLATTARRVDGGWVLNGAKRWIGMGTVADVVITWARDEADDVLKAFLVRPSTPGFSSSKITPKLGLRIMQNADLTYEDVFVPESDRLPEGDGFDTANELLLDSRAWVGWQAVGLAHAVLDDARDYAGRREQFGRSLAHFQTVQGQIAHIGGNATAAMGMMIQMARLQEDGRLKMAQAAMAKATCTRLTREAASLNRDLHGGNGLVTQPGHIAAKLLADAEIIYTYEGTYTINSLIVARALTGVSAFV
jgi:glutaryl-CoA dehydrogenase